MTECLLRMGRNVMERERERDPGLPALGSQVARRPRVRVVGAPYWERLEYTLRNLLRNFQAVASAGPGRISSTVGGKGRPGVTR